MTSEDGPRKLGPLDNEIHRLSSLHDQLLMVAGDIDRLWFDSWRGPASGAFDELRERLAARPRRIGKLVYDAMSALRDYRTVRAERPAASAHDDLLSAWRQRLAAAGATAADKIRAVSRELAGLQPILGPAGAPTPAAPALPPPPARRPEPRRMPTPAQLPPAGNPGYSDHTASVCDELLDADFGELAEDG